MNCKDKGWEVGQVFEVTNAYGERLDKNDIIVLTDDDNSTNPWFDIVKGRNYPYKQLAYCLDDIRRIWPPEKETVTVECEGNKVEISRESAKALNLI